MTTRDIRVATTHTTCDVCGRNLLRGEHAERYVAGGEGYWVCDLCVPRALEDGWVREGTIPPQQPDEDQREHRRPLLPRIRARLAGLLGDGEGVGPEEDRDLPYSVYKSEKTPAPMRTPERIREPRHVHAVPTSPQQKVSSALQTFNGSEHTRTIAGVARSLGPPSVTIRPSELEASVVRVVAAWELCWYRYEIDLADELPSVRVAARGAELDELQPIELEGNASADEDGVLALRS